MQTKNTKVAQNPKLKSRPAILAAVLASKDLTGTYSGLQQFSTVKSISAPKTGKIQPAPSQPRGDRRRDPIVEAWGSYLDHRHWQLWTTLTTGRELTLPGARRSINKLSQYLKENNYPAEIFWAAEPFDLKEGYHLHSLIRFQDIECGQDNKPHYNALVKGWRQITGDNSARIYSERYKQDKGAHYYVGKYISKSRCDYDIIAPGLIDHDQTDDKLVSQDSLTSYLKKKETEAARILQRKVWVSELQKKGIYAGKPDPDPEVYTDTRITYEAWERSEYKRDLTARLQIFNTVHDMAQNIRSEKFTLRSN